eukprot:TRINITY_DN3126_c0_g1_i1.p1 TRINITY_DN3126_c0_g1~~TRINITY_DN3126_c0_g1_i1.p1  ORF type:complete len:226 (-),score=88.75 TRINITY_DN3126_c0_g1_i1:23-652(-)
MGKKMDGKMTVSRKKQKAYQFLVRSAEIVAWLEEVLDTSFETDDIFELLSDGVRLCQIANVFQENIIPKIHSGSQPAYHRENIEKFINAAIVLGMRPEQLFAVPDLYESKNLPSVVDALHEFSSIVAAKADKKKVKSSEEGAGKGPAYTMEKIDAAEEKVVVEEDDKHKNVEFVLEEKVKDGVSTFVVLAPWVVERREMERKLKGMKMR